MSAPDSETMGDELMRIIGPTKGLLVRQKLDKLEIFCPALQKRNKYKVAAMPSDIPEEASEWQDERFKKALKKDKVFTIKEKSEFCDRICCGRFRRFQAEMHASKKVGGSKENIATFDRPFKCTLFCGCCLINPQEITALDKDGNKIGRTVQDFRCMDQFCARQHWRVEDAEGDAKYIIQDNLCCNCQACSPSLCCPVRTLKIFEAGKEDEEVGTLKDYFPGCSLRGCFGTADNFKLTFPSDASPAMKVQLLASVVLIDFMLFEKAEDEGI